MINKKIFVFIAICFVGDLFCSNETAASQHVEVKDSSGVGYMENRGVVNQEFNIQILSNNHCSITNSVGAVLVTIAGGIMFVVIKIAPGLEQTIPFPIDIKENIESDLVMTVKRSYGQFCSPGNHPPMPSPLNPSHCFFCGNEIRYVNPSNFNYINPSYRAISQQFSLPSLN
ncbi:MAG: hypothetical protein HEEMFOPI_01579 [Holosporales bacterium]